MEVVLVTTVIGAVIGFGTNLLAIVMLFRPWTEWRLFGVRVPLTPGLIPKRQPEIADKLGEVVEQHLLTDEGIVASLSRPDWIEEMRSRILNWLETILAQDRTVRALLVRVTGKTADELTEQAEKWARAACEANVLPLIGSKRMRELIPTALRERIGERIDRLAGMLLEKGKQWVDSPDMRQFMALTIQERLLAGGMLGRMAVMFVQEDKLVDEILPHLKKWLASPDTLRFVQDKLQAEWQFLLDRNAGEVLQEFAGQRELGTAPQFDLCSGVIAGSVRYLTECILDWDVYEQFQKQRLGAVDFLDRCLGRLQQSSVQWVGPILRSLGIRRIVERQVASFPIPKLEKLVVDVVNKELKMITWLGALLGGLIGLIQALLIVKWH
ncbi:DUF445 family protein [Effusibacillus pohliae]|uniref:DUF445 family protein n=1 Tax=Effusibacillus pohliae TaxID=232270 RepID=UPI000380674F|nr:DUF445 family protein [Effusibacillus pohliae]